MIDFNPDFIGHEPPDELRQQLAAEKLANGKLVASLVGPKLPLGSIVSAPTVASPSVTNLTAAMREFADVSRDGITAWLRNIAKVRGMIAQARTIGGMDAACDETELSLKHQLQEVAAHCQRLLQEPTDPHTTEQPTA